MLLDGFQQNMVGVRAWPALDEGKEDLVSVKFRLSSAFLDESALSDVSEMF